MDLSKLLNFEYLFARFPEAGFSWPVRIGLLIIFVGAIIVALYTHKKLKQNLGVAGKAWKRLQVWSWSVGLVGIMLVYFREVRALYLSSRFWLILWLLVSVVWLIYIIAKWKKDVPNKETQEKHKQEYSKWLPKQNK
ncbi:hypothetical protein HOB10_05135 [Candidatus Parcubacteria bacterium]|jgi:hypothetical protein|nr:hypothetical protein [Candidatus Parcubacteria bacterium]